MLFVHGHLGSHQQMRSAAAETGRELARRAAADPAGWPLWLPWYAVDFNAEASALDSSVLVGSMVCTLCLAPERRATRACLDLLAPACRSLTCLPPTQQTPFSLQAEQASFVLRCIEHLRQQHAADAQRATAAAGVQPCGGQRSWGRQRPPFRVLLVAYSMGGLVARQVVRRLAADPSFGERLAAQSRAWPVPQPPWLGAAIMPRRGTASRGAAAPPPPSTRPGTPPPAIADMAQLTALLTLGSPDHFPSFMPHTPLRALFNRTLATDSDASGSAEGRAAAVAAAAASVPSVNILAGPGDFSLPLTHASAAGPALEGQGARLALLMRDMPGVWATCSHKVSGPGPVRGWFNGWVGGCGGSPPCRVLSRLMPCLPAQA